MPARDEGLLNEGHDIGAVSDQGEVITLRQTALQTLTLGCRTFSELADDPTGGPLADRPLPSGWPTLEAKICARLGERSDVETSPPREIAQSARVNA